MSDKPNDGRTYISYLPLKVSAKKDAFLAFPYILTIVLFVVQAVLIFDDDERTIALQILIVLSLPVIVLLFLLLGIKYLVQKRSKSSASLIFSIPILIFLIGFPGASTWGQYARDLAYFSRFTKHEAEYLEAIKSTSPDSRGFRYKEFVWDFRFGGEGTRLIYDESDELRLSEERRSQAWWNNIDEHSRGYFENCLSGVYEVKLHFYVVRLICG